MVEVKVSFLDLSSECLHLDSVDVLVLFVPGSKAGGSGIVRTVFKIMGI